MDEGNPKIARARLTKPDSSDGNVAKALEAQKLASKLRYINGVNRGFFFAPVLENAAAMLEDYAILLCGSTPK
jgi:hypothetical protein